jgi:hypothetical protein
MERGVRILLLLVLSECDIVRWVFIAVLLETTNPETARGPLANSTVIMMVIVTTANSSKVNVVRSMDFVSLFSSPLVSSSFAQKKKK